MQTNNVFIDDRLTHDLRIIERETMLDATEMDSASAVANRGIIKSFKDNEELKRNLPNNLGISWMHLAPNEVWDTHRHRTGSILIAVEGAGSSQGDTEKSFSAGDVLYIPALSKHGFTGSEPKGLWALSIQFHHFTVFENKTTDLPHIENDPDILPPLSKRQINTIPNKNTTFPATFKSQPELNSIIPQNINLSWRKITRNQEILAPEQGYLRLLILCKGKAAVITSLGCTKHEDWHYVQPGSSFWQYENTIITPTNSVPIQALIIDIKK